MITIYKSTNNEGNSALLPLNSIESGCWINLVAPTDQEILLISKKTGVSPEFLKSALDEEETSRIDIEKDNMIFIVDIPFTEMEDNSLIYDTFPLAIIHTNDAIITVCLKNSKMLTDFVEGKIKSFFTFKRSRFTLQILYKVASYYLLYLRQIDKKSLLIEKRLHKSMKNNELIQLLSLEKSLVYFSTSLKANEITLEKMMKLDMVLKYQEDQGVLEDVIIENKQAIEMATIYSNILSSTMDAFASVISNNLNVVIKFLAAITIVMSIPNIISGLYSMNVQGLPFSKNPYAFWIILLIVGLSSAIVAIVLDKKDMF